MHKKYHIYRNILRHNKLNDQLHQLLIQRDDNDAKLFRINRQMQLSLTNPYEYVQNSQLLQPILVEHELLKVAIAKLRKLYNLYTYTKYYTPKLDTIHEA